MCTCMCKQDLHWLPVEFWIEFKILLLVFKALNGIYRSTLYLWSHQEKASIRSSLRSNDLTLLEVPRTKCKTFVDRAFAFAGPSKWNKLPLAIRTAKNLNTFKKHLKTFKKKKKKHMASDYYLLCLFYFLLFLFDWLFLHFIFYWFWLKFSFLYCKRLNRISLDVCLLVF